MVITDTGSVGIGTASPKSILTANGNIVGLSTGTHSWQHYQQASSSYTVTSIDSVIDGATGNLVFKTSANWTNSDAAEKARIDSSGRLLVGTSTFSGGARAVFRGNTAASGTQGVIILQRDSANPSTTQGLGEIRFQDSNEGWGASISAEGDATWSSPSDCPTKLVFSTTLDGASSPTARAQITNKGRFDVFGDSSTDSLIVTNAAGSGTSVSFISCRHSSTGFASGTESFRVFTNGNAQNTNGSFTAISDQKLKENIIDASSQWDDLKAIQIRNWNFKEETGYETHRQIGPVAQELEQICPGLVFETPDRDADGNETGEVTKGVNQSVLYMKAVKALQEAMERIEQLEAKVAALEGA